MWAKSVKKNYQDVEANIVWKVIADINNWHSWIENVDKCTLEGSTEAGKTFTLKPSKGPAVKVLIEQIEEGVSLTNETKFFGAVMHDTTMVEKKDGGVELSMSVKISGPLTFLWKILVGKQIVQGGEKSLDNLVRVSKNLMTPKS